MTARYGNDYQPVRPWGRKGDAGNDGFLSSTGHYFQIYAPNPTTRETEVYAAGKARDDFDKLKASRSNLMQYSFVVNDRFCGMPDPVIQALAEIVKSHAIPAQPFTSGHLEEIFFDLDDIRKMSIVQSAPLTTPEWIDPSMVAELLEHLSTSPDIQFALMSSNDTVPEFDQKIQFNNLNAEIAQHLRRAAGQIGHVDVFLNKRPGLAPHIAKELNGHYTNSLNLIPEIADKASDLRFVYILEQILPPVAKNSPAVMRVAWQHIGLIVMAKYFETCDIYERPDSINSA